MPVQQLSPWTMAWFGAAAAFLLLSLALGLAGAVGPGDWARGAGLAVVHLFTLGWLGLMMLGALIQFVPVLTALPLARPVLALPALLAAITGTATLTCGFLWLDGHDGAKSLFLTAPWLLALAFGLAGAMIAPPLVARASRGRSEVRMVLLALTALAGLWASGAVMVLNLTGTATPALLPEGLPLHILFGIGGWLSLAAFGVSYKLFAMFLLAPEQHNRLRQAVFLTGGLGLMLLVLTFIALALGHTPAAPLIWLLALLPALAVGLYLAEAARIWRQRRRPQPEPNMRWSRVALAFLAAAALMAIPALSQGGIWVEPAIFAALTGWLSLLTLAQMIKITSFLTWMQVFAPRIGRGPVPMVHELTDPRAAGRWLALWAAGAAGGSLALLLVQPFAFRLALAALLLAAVGLVREMLAIRRLSHLTPALRPDPLPPLVFPAPHAEIRP